jgi:glucose/mannose-6-phosphate isomerase
VRHRIELTQWIVDPNAQKTYRLETQGRNAVERVFSLVLLGDLVSVYLAVLRGIDPGPVAVLDRLKEQLAER